MRKLIALILSAALLLCCVPAMAEEAAPVKTGLSIITNMTADKQTNINLTAVTVDDNGVITACVIDYIQAKVAVDGTGVITTELGYNFLSKHEKLDDYGMRPVSTIGKEWFEQAQAFAAYCVGKTVEEVKGIALNESGYPADADLAAGCTMKVTEYIAGVEDAVAKAAHIGAKKGDVLKLTQVTVLDKAVNATAEKEGNFQVYGHAAAITLAGDVVSSIVIDEVQAAANFDATGALTSDISAEYLTKLEKGDAYGMKPVSPIGKEWFEQSAAFCAYVTGKTLTEATGIAMNESGYPTDADLTAGCTMNVSAMVELIEKAK